MNKPRSVPSPLLRRIVAKTALEGAGRICNVLLSLAGARWLGPAGWGVFWPAFGLAHWAGMATDLGGHLTLARMVAREPGRRRGYFSTGLRLKGALAGLGAIGLAAFAPRLPFPPALLVPLAAALLALSFTEWLGSYLRGQGRIVAESGLLAADCIAAFACGMATLVAGGGPVALAISQLAAHLLVLAAAWRWVAGSAAPAAPPRPFAPFLLASLPTGLAILISLGSWRLGLLVLVRGDIAGAGQYAAAHRLLEAARFLPAIVAAALFPSFARRTAVHAPWPTLLFLTPLTGLAALALSRPVAAEWLTTCLYGAAYLPAASSLAILIWALPCMAVSSVLTTWLVARGRIRTNAALSLAHLAAHAAGLAWLLPARAAPGAAWALVGAEVVLAAGAVAVMPRKSG